ncbi:hypothetical protein LZC95_00930 [Pendulispora brunnea]|uniref:Uncharacterized protein n=1 Tax=Pendulispora brunnea TaxID=2905690 RepID=A0ABZ2KBE6_9BACT
MKRSATANLEGARIRIFQEAFPAGIRMGEGMLEVERGYQHRLIGK